MMPRRTAMVTASVRSLAPSFSMMCLTCTLTVSSEMNSRSRDFAIPVAAGDVLQDVYLALGQQLVPDVLRQLRGDLAGECASCPAWTWRTASASSFGGMFLSM